MKMDLQILVGLLALIILIVLELSISDTLLDIYRIKGICFSVFAHGHQLAG